MKETLQRLFHKHHQDLLTQNKAKMEKEKML
jgi:dynein heavy chain